uniref:Uncharacterized protein n=1 Tax=Octopus bimaculoides TaxID=37653 RepID=A0A0L8H1L8_OCTBM
MILTDATLWLTKIPPFRAPRFHCDRHISKTNGGHIILLRDLLHTDSKGAFLYFQILLCLYQWFE